MRRAVIIVCVVGALPGCFYYESINQRPAIEIENLDSNPKSPGDTVDLRAVTNDPDGDFIQLSWRVYACTDAEKFQTHGNRESCDETPFYEKSDEAVSFTIPALRTFIDEGSQLSAESALVILEAKDEFGATARPRAQLIVPIINKTPTLVLEKQSKYSFVEGTPVRLLAKVGDDDDGPERLSLSWTVNPPTATGFVAELVDASPALISDPEDPKHLQHAKIFTANDAGEWTVDVTVSDPLGNRETQQETINVIVDQAPCLAQLSPIVPPAGAALPMSAPTLFRVPVVRDDLDPYPLIPDDEIFRATRFRWSIQNPGSGSHAVVPGATGNSLQLDPDSYTPGDFVEVRVEIFDRKNTPIPCPGDQATCSTISQPTCLQRQTWRVEVR
ncbi:MAG: hypothetical protein ACKV2T_26925 [Kofleriaceae bacterium]